MTRRKFFGILSLGIIGIFIGIGSIVFRDFENTVRKILIEDVGHLNIKISDIDKYIADAKKKNTWNKYDFVKTQFIRTHFLISNYIELAYYEKYIQYRSEIVGHFLLSTNFFINKMDETASINYTSVYDPYETPCANPFSYSYYNSN